MTKKVVWRTDADVFEPGNEMRSRGDHAVSMDGAHKATEAKLRAEMENGQEVRARSLYTWRDEDWARATWTATSERTKYLYKLQIDDEDIRHVGDVCYYNEIGKALKDKASPDSAIRAYVTGAAFVPQCHYKPRVEILVTEATVLERFDPPPITALGPRPQHPLRAKAHSTLDSVTGRTRRK